MNYNNYDFEELFGSRIIVMVIIIVLSVTLLIGIALYVLNSIGLYRMAKKVGNDRAWLAWIPIANTWLMFTLPDSEYRILAINKVIQSRSNAFWIFFGGRLCVAFAFMLLSMIPFIGWFAVLLGPLLDIAVMVMYIFMLYPVYQDLYELFLPEDIAKNYAIASMICVFFAPVVPPILILVASGKDPVCSH